MTKLGIYFIGGKLPPKMVLEGTLFGPFRLREPTPEEKGMWEIIKQLSKLSNEDEWWFWKRIGGKESLNRLQLRLEKQQMEAFLESFGAIFDNEWWSSACKRRIEEIVGDPLSAFGGQFPLIRILRLGECIYNLGGKEKLPSDLVRRLKNEKSFRSAAAELEIASCFIQAGFRLEMYPSTSSGSSPEGKVTIEENSIYYEVTEQHWSGYDIDARRYESRVIDWLAKNCNPLTGSIKFKQGGNNPGRKISRLLELFENHCKSRSLDPLPFEFKSDDFEVHLKRGDANGAWIGINGLEPTTEKIVRNWVNRLFKKAKQLPSGESGVIIGSPSFLWGPDEVKYAYDAVHKEIARGSHTRISGIILCAKHVENSGFAKHVPSIIINDNAEIDNREAIERMAQALFGFPDWL